MKAPAWDAGTSTAPTWDNGAAVAHDENTKEDTFMTAADGAPVANGEGGGDNKTYATRSGILLANAPRSLKDLASASIAAKKAIPRRNVPTNASLLVLVGSVLKKVIKHAIARTSRLFCAATARKKAMKVYQKACKDVSYEEIERSFRTNDIGIYLIATEPAAGELLDTHTLVNLSGKRDCKYKLGYFFKKTPRTAKMAEGWPSSETENLARLKDAGVPFERGIPKCLRCKGNLVTMPLSALSRVPQKVWSARDARKLAILQRTAPTILVADEPAATADVERKATLLKNARSPRTRQIQLAETVSRSDTSAKIVPSHATGAR
ncbi:MAG: hypothetical protein Q9196_004011 [Gyalolechia fulgens]